MKRIRRTFSLVLSLVLAVCLSIPAFAADPTYTLTINSETPNHDYQVYQVFAGDLAKVPGASTDTLVNITWGSGVNNDADALINAVKAIDMGSAGAPSKPFENCKTADDVATVLAKNNNNAALVDAFAAVVAEHLAADPTGTGTTTGVAKPYIATIDNLSAGYYLVKEAEFTGNEGDNNAYTKFILKIVKNETVEAKADVPTVDKQVKNSTGTSADATTASVGSEVTFTLTSAVPEMDGYNKYYFIVNDTLSKGLTLDVNSIAVTLGGTPLTKDEDYTVTIGTGADSATTLKIVFKNFIQYKVEDVGKQITITYDATINENAVVGTTGNINTADLTYSNDPNYNYTGGDEPGTDPKEPTGTTPDTISVVYVSGIQINKVDADGRPLTGAGFTLTGDGVIKTGVTTNTFAVDGEGTYYKLKTGAFTTTAPVITGGEDDTSKFYESTTIKYEPTASTQWIEKAGWNEQTGMTGADGVVKFTGLGAGTYTIEETTVPENYNKIDNITVILNCQVPDTITTGEETCTWSGTYKIGSGQAQSFTVNNGIVTLDVENRSGAELPSTGGMGTTMFMYGGIGLMVLALAVLAVRTYEKRKNA